MLMEKKANFYILSLGCPKNEVDAESMSYALRLGDFNFVADPTEATYLIVNTCGFIQSAKEEAIAAILDLADYKQERIDRGLACYLIVTGCLGQRYARQIYDEFPEVDLVLGTAEYADIVASLEALEDKRTLRGHLPGRPGSLRHLFHGEQAADDRSYAYLKIAEGCSNLCSFCAIPYIRGPLLSRPIEDIVREAEILSQRGFKEIILVAQDTTRYGLDLYGKPRLLDLLKALLQVKNIGLIRILYVYGDVFSEELMDLIASTDKIASYVDLPIQHASDKILKAMRRRETNASLRELIGKLRSKIPGLILRTTIMVGFPGETEEDYEQLKTFVKDMQFDRLGCFIFSPEEGTRAYRMSDLPDEKTSHMRYAEIMNLQKGISLARNRARLNRVYPVLLESISQDGLFYEGRSYGETPGIDPSIHVLAQREGLKLGDIVPVKLIDADEYDMTGVTVDEFT